MDGVVVQGGVDPRGVRLAATFLAIVGAWMVFDGGRALLVGDYYVTPSSGAYAGQLGPWADLLRAAGVEPRAGFVKVFFVAQGAFSLACAVGLVRHARLVWPWALAASALLLWYLPFGTLAGVAAGALLLRARRASGEL